MTILSFAVAIGNPIDKGTTPDVRQTLEDGTVVGPVNGTWQLLPDLTPDQFYALLDPFIKLLETERNERTAEHFSGLHKSAIEAGRRGYNHTMTDWAWGEYYAVSKKGLKSLTPKWCRRK